MCLPFPRTEKQKLYGILEITGLILETGHQGAEKSPGPPSPMLFLQKLDSMAAGPQLFPSQHVLVWIYSSPQAFCFLAAAVESWVPPLFWMSPPKAHSLLQAPVWWPDEKMEILYRTQGRKGDIACFQYILKKSHVKLTSLKNQCFLVHS